MDPTSQTLTQPGFLSRCVSRLYPEDPQALVTLASAVVLLASLVAVVVGIVHQLWTGHDIALGTMATLGVALAAPCALAHVKAPILPIGLAGSIAPGAPAGCGATPSAAAQDTESADRSNP